MSAAPRSGAAPERLRVLRLLLTPGPTSAPYNQFSLAWRHRHEIALCAFFEPTLPIPPEIRLYRGGGSVVGFLRALVRALREGPYDVVHAHSPHVAFLFLLAGALVRGPLPPAVYTLHTSYPNLKLRNRLLLLPVFARFRRIVCCSQSSLESLPGSFRRLAGARLSAVRNGLDIARVDAALAGAAAARDPRGFCVVSVGRLMELKNPGVILRAFREVAGPGARLRLIGAGPLEAALRRESRELELEGQVELTGLVPREEVYRSLRDADLYVSASRCEGLPVSTLEAMACGIPVVLSDIPPHREIAEGCDFIPLVPLGDAEALARELAAFRALPAAARREIGARGRAWVERRFGLEAMERGYEAVYAGARSGSG